jgi:hypothetical protein
MSRIELRCQKKTEHSRTRDTLRSAFRALHSYKSQMPEQTQDTVPSRVRDSLHSTS